MSRRPTVLFLCTGNSCRSQMAEGWARKLHPVQFEACSAGTDPGRLDPRTVRVMAEAGIDISGQRSKHVDAFAGVAFDWIITVCDRAQESCPVLPGEARRLHAGFDDPPGLAAGAASEEDALAPYRRVRDEIRDYVAEIPRLISAGAADPASRGEITRLLQSWSGGNRDSFDRLFPLVYDALRDLARRQLRRRSQAATLHTTDLVHEAYLKLVDPTRVSVQDRDHFFALASRAMRQILVDHARRRSADKRGGGVAPEALQEWDAPVTTHPTDVLAVDQALGRLEALDDRLGRLVEMRFFGGLSVEEAAGALGISERTVKRDWQKARAFLYRELIGTPPA